MAIRPVDLQLAYLAGPQNAAQVSSAQAAPQAAQQAAAAVFTSQLHEREETVAESADSEGAHLRADSDGGGNAGEYTPQGRREGSRDEDPAPRIPGEGDHFIDVSV